MRSKLLTAATQVSDHKINIYGFVMMTDGSNAAAIDIYNEATSAMTAAKKVLSGRCPAAGPTVSVLLPKPVMLSAGCYVNITGTNASVYILIA